MTRPARGGAVRNGLAGALIFTLAACADTIGPPDGFVYASVAAGGAHTCGVATDGGVYCWGAGAQGQLGNDRGVASARPVRVSLAPAATAVSAGDSHACALTTDHEIFCWGSGDRGQLGVGTVTSHGTPARITPARPYRGVVAGAHHTCALSGAGEAWCWGRNDDGQLGTGGTEPAQEPVRVATGVLFASLSAGAAHSCGVATDGHVWCWGRNQLGQLGSGTSQPSAVPVAVVGGRRFLRVSAGFGHSCGVTETREVFCWGSSRHGELGVGHVVGDFDVPGGVMPFNVGLVGALDVSAGVYVSCATTDAFAHCWGRGGHGQLGIGWLYDQARPQRVPEPSPGFAQAYSTLHLRQVSAGGGTHVCARAEGGGVFCWGEGTQGQLGTGRSLSLSPLRVLGER